MGTKKAADDCSFFRGKGLFFHYSLLGAGGIWMGGETALGRGAGF